MRRYLLLSLFALTAHGADQAVELLPTEVVIIEQAAVKSRKGGGGGSTSIGTDAYDVRTQTAWFYGKKPIVTCYNSTEAFGFKDRELSALMESTIKLWRDYFLAKKINKSGSELAPNANFKFTGKCKGDEDFVVFFGTGPIFGSSQDLKAVQKLNYPAAYANKTHMSRDLKWGKGYIRIVASGYYGENPSFPDWKKPGALQAVLAHEFGHVLGFSHTPGTLMRSELVEQVFSEDTVPSRLEIDGNKQLVSCEECSSTFRLTKVGGSLFEQLGLKKEIKLLKSGGGLKLSDGKSSLSVVETSRSTLDSGRTLWSNFAEPLNDSSLTYNLYAYVSAKDKKVPLIFEFNAGGLDSDVVVRSTENGEVREVGRFDRE